MTFEFKKIEPTTEAELDKIRSIQLRKRAVQILEEVIHCAKEDGEPLYIPEEKKERLLQNYINSALRELRKSDIEFKKSIENSQK